MKINTENIKIILASRPKMLSEVIRNMIEHQPDMHVVGEVLDPIELLHAAKTIAVDVVIITPLKVTGEPRICRHLLDDHPQLKIVILSVDSKDGFLYQSDVPALRIDDPCEETILSTLRASIGQN